MKCPNCNETLTMADRQGIEIDYCPNCRGVWLDRGELDKIIERTSGYTPPPQQQQTAPPQQQQQTDYYEKDKDYYNKDKDYYDKDKRYPSNNPYNDPHYKNRKKKGFLSDFFDFD